MAVQKGAISFGLVYIPVALYSATQDNNIRFHQLARDKNGELKRVRYQKTCDGCKPNLEAKDIVKGYEYEKGRYVVVTDEDMEKIKTEKDRTIQIVRFVDAGDIPSVYFDRSYYAISDQGGQKPFELLRQAMKKAGKVAIGKTVLGQSETVVAIMASGDGLLCETLYFPDEIKSMPAEQAHPEVSPEELDMAVRLIDALSGAFDLSGIRDEYQDRLRDLIQAKISGSEIAEPEQGRRDNVIDLMDALKASLEQSQQSEGKPKRKPRRKAGA